MSDLPRPQVAVVDYGMGNLFSVRSACERFGLAVTITSSPEAVLESDAIILPGIGAFGDAARMLRQIGLADAIREFIKSSRPLIGICLGMQLLMDESTEFGHHEGLGLVHGRVIRIEAQPQNGRLPKVPQVGWNTLTPSPSMDEERWHQALLGGIEPGAHMYFVHSYHVVPEDPRVQVAVTTYGGVEFCSVLAVGNIIGFQGHPERSGTDGLRVYRNLARMLRRLVSKDGRTEGRQLDTCKTLL